MTTDDVFFNGSPKPDGVRLVVVGAGNRARKYLKYAEENPGKIQVVGVVDPNPVRREKIASRFGIPSRNVVSGLEEARQIFSDADAALITTPEHLHHKGAMMAIGEGCHVLIEKPVAITVGEAEEIMEAARKNNVVAGVCHVLRYHPYFEKIKGIIASGELGKVVSVSHRVKVGIDRACHTFVRGIWGESSSTSPLVISKCCHDIDLMHWFVGKPVVRVSSFGSCGWFGAVNAPEGSAKRCIDCSIEKRCAYSAVDLYRRRGEWTANFDVPEGSTLEEEVERELKDGRFGRCVYHCDNDVADRQVVALEFEDGTVGVISLDLFTKEDNRETRICLTGGEIYGDEKSIEIIPLKGKRRRYEFDDNMPFHSGADIAIMEDFVTAICDRSHKMRAPIECAVESQRVCCDAEHSRLDKR